MKVPELPLEPMENSRLIIGATDEVEDDDRIHELVQIADRKTKPEWVGPSAELMPGGDDDG